jgi:acyl dehydratase
MTLDDVRRQIGRELAVSDWLEVSQDRIDRFADATGDHQWIHVDQERAAAESPFRTTIAHGFLTLSLVSVLLRDAVAMAGVRMALNYGCNRVRFVSPVPAGSSLRARAMPASMEEVEGGRALQVAWTVTIERRGAPRPACVVEWLVRYYSNEQALQA